MTYLKLIVILIIIIVTNVCYSQSENWNVLTLQRDLYSINFLTQNKVWVFAGDYSYRSSDSGVNWNIPFKNNVNIGTRLSNQNYIYFTDSLYGWATKNTNNFKNNKWRVKLEFI